jgi:uncharacterized protein
LYSEQSCENFLKKCAKDRKFQAHPADSLTLIDHFLLAYALLLASFEGRMMKKLNEGETTQLLSKQRIGRLGCVDNGEPYVVPINYLFENGVIYSHSLPGHKIDVLRAHPRACLQVDEVENDFEWRSVIAFGKFEELRAPGDRRSALSKLLARFPLLTPVESVMAADASPSDSVVFSIRVDRITGVAEGNGSYISVPMLG